MKNAKIFYIGMQRCGTTSFGDFFEQNGYSRWGWQETQESGLSELVFKRKYLDILDLQITKNHSVFEDGPFFQPDFAKFIANYIPESKFVYFSRPAEDWYASLLTHSMGFNPGELERHCLVYDRLDELAFLRERCGDTLQKLPIIGMKSHYTKCYELHKSKVLYMFSDLPKERFFSGELYDKDKYFKLKEQFGLNLHSMEDVKSNVTTHDVSDVVDLFNKLEM